MKVNGNITQCLDACSDQLNKLTITSRRFPNKHTFVDKDTFCLLFLRLNTSCHSEKAPFLTQEYPNICSNINQTLFSLSEGPPCAHDLKWPTENLSTLNQTLSNQLERDFYQYAKKNMMILNVFINELTVTQILKDEKISTISFIANTGGLLGLCMGFSLITIFELIYHLILFVKDLVFRLKKSQKQIKDGVNKPSIVYKY